MIDGNSSPPNKAFESELSQRRQLVISHLSYIRIGDILTFISTDISRGGLERYIYCTFL
jgi:hypothetical protein